jgi:hypothetical protein
MQVLRGKQVPQDLQAALDHKDLEVDLLVPRATKVT